MRAIWLILAFIWLVLIAYAQGTCSVFPSFGTQCHDERLDVWMLPFFLTVVGLPAVVASLKIIVKFIRDR